MAIKLGKSRGELPDTKDYYPPKWKRREAIEEYDLEHKGETDRGPMIRLGFIAAFSLASLVSAIVATFCMDQEGQSLFLIIVEIYAPMVITWSAHFLGEMVEGYYLTVPGIAIAGISFMVNGTPSCLWIALAAGFSLLAFIAIAVTADYM